MLSLLPYHAQEKDISTGSEWSHEIQSWLYLAPSGTTSSPIYAAVKVWLHLEASYNYEDLNTVSAWLGYNIQDGNKFLWTITRTVTIPYPR